MIMMPVNRSKDHLVSHSMQTPPPCMLMKASRQMLDRRVTPSRHYRWLQLFRHERYSDRQTEKLMV